MPDIKKILDNPHTDDPQRAGREHDLQPWGEAEAQQRAAREGIELTQEHWEVLQRLRDHYLEHGLPSSGRDVSDFLDGEFADLGGRKYLRRLFPNGPVAQGMRIAGLPIPAHTEDAGFGISR